MMEKALILLVDDNSKNLQVLGNLLENTYRTAIAQNGLAALKFVNNRPPDLILLDIMMPGMNGFEVCRRLKASADTRDIPIIFLSARTETEDIVTGFAAGGVDYITKPFHQEELLARISTQVLLQEQTRTLNTYARVVEEKNTALRAKNGELDRKNAQLQEINACKDRFFSIIAHDLRGPLGSLHQLAELIVENLEDYPKDMLLRFLTTQRDSAKHLLGLLENLLTWARMQQGMIKTRPDRISIRNIIAQNITLFTPNADQKQIALTSSVPNQLIAYADFDMVNTVVRNLISNALKFTHPEGTVAVAAHNGGSYVEISVADTGIGIDADHLPNMFRLDAKYQRPGTAQEAGTGLGLQLCKEFVGRNGGTIGVHSEIGKGTTFTFTLPKPSL